MASHEAIAGSDEWQPIETAPRDGTWIVVLMSESTQDKDMPSPCVATARWVRETTKHWEQIRPTKKELVELDTSHWSNYENPTHWRPLPAPPGSPSRRPEPDEERVARAIYEASIAGEERHHDAWDDIPEPYRGQLLVEARAAIRAMEE